MAVAAAKLLLLMLLLLLSAGGYLHAPVGADPRTDTGNARQVGCSRRGDRRVRLLLLLLLLLLRGVVVVLIMRVWWFGYRVGVFEI